MKKRILISTMALLALSIVRLCAEPASATQVRRANGSRLLPVLHRLARREEAVLRRAGRDAQGAGLRRASATSGWTRCAERIKSLD